MTDALIDTSVLIDHLRGRAAATRVLEKRRARGLLHGSEITRLEVLAGMRPSEAEVTHALLSTLLWHPVDEAVATAAGELGREWLPGNRGIDAADLAIAATAQILGADLLTCNIKHFPMCPGLRAPY